MYFNQMRIVWFGRDFYWSVDDIYFGVWGDLVKECFDIVILQMNIVRIYLYVNVEIGVCIMK